MAARAPLISCLRGYPCITHTLTGALAEFGFVGDPRLAGALDHIRSTQREDGGWHPNATLARGRERAAEPSCPFGTLHVLRAATRIGGDVLDAVGPAAGDYLLSCWTRREEPFRPVGFGMGSVFAKLAYPFATFGLLALVDTLTAAPTLRADPRLASMHDVLVRKRAPDGYRAETVSRAWSAFDFGQKRTASPWMTAMADRTAARMGRG